MTCLNCVLEYLPHPAPHDFGLAAASAPWYIQYLVSFGEWRISPAHARASTKSSLKVLNRRPNYSEFF
jgi:hypothetical protein